MADQRNLGRGEAVAVEQANLGDLPPGKIDHRQRVAGIKVHKSSTMVIKRNTYSVPSRLIGQCVAAVIDADVVKVYYAQP